MEFQAGDIGSTKGKGLLGQLNQTAFVPQTDRFHFFIIWKRLWDGDYLILESVKKGLAIGRLSWYKGKDIEIYRVNCPIGLRRKAPFGLIDWGRSRYDYWLFVKIPIGAIAALAKILYNEHKVRKLKAEDLPYGTNSALICTEAVDVAYDSVGVNLIPEGVPPLPSAFKQALLDGRMELIYKGELK